MFLKKTISLIMVVSLLQWALPTLSYSATKQPVKLSQGILLNPEAAAKLDKKLDYCLQTEKLVVVLEGEKKELLVQKELTEKKIVNLNLNVEEYKKEAKEFKEAYVKKNEELNKLQENVPSRMTWFGIGAGTMGIIAIVLAVLVAR